MLQRNTNTSNEKADSDLVRRQNRRIVLDALRREGNLARVELGRVTGLSPASITAISSQLIEESIIEEVNVPMGAALTGKRGRPVVRLSLRAKAAHVVAVKVSIGDVKLVLADFQGRVVVEQALSLPTYDTAQSEYGTTLAQAIGRFIQQNDMLPRNVSRIGIAVQGVADIKSGSILWSPAFRSARVPLAQPIIDALGIAVQIGNDANMMAEGFRARSNGHGVTAVIFTGYGVGMGLILNGQVFHGATGAAAEFGHMNHMPGGPLCRCGKRGCIEAYAADYGILRSAGLTNTDAPIAAVDANRMQGLMLAAENGDATVCRAFEQAGTALGYGLARLIAILNPDRIVLAGPGTRALQLMEPALRQALADGVVEELSRHVTIELVSFDTDLIMRGTIDALLRTMDHDVFAVGPLAPAPKEIMR